MSGILTTKQRRAALEAVIVQHPIFKEARKTLGRLADQVTGDAREIAGRARIVVGESGAGKTQLLRWVEAQDWARPDLGGGEGDRRRFLYVELAKGVTDREIVASIMRRLGEDPNRTSTKFQILDELKTVSAGIGLRVVVLDEAHWMMKSVKAEVREGNAEFLKTILNVTGLHIIPAGVRDLNHLHDLYHAQARRRLLTRIHLRPYNWGLMAERAAFQAILRRYEQALEYPAESGIGKADLSARLYLVSKGELGVVVQYLLNAIELADDVGARCITATMLAEVHDGLRAEVEMPVVGGIDTFVTAPTQPGDNPFSCGTKELKELWTKQFGKPTDASRQTKLAPGPVPGTGAKA